jgi:hypothetical protein
VNLREYVGVMSSQPIRRSGAVQAARQYLLGRRDEAVGVLAGDDVRQLIASLKPQQAVAYELAGGQPASLFVCPLPRPDHELARRSPLGKCDHLRLGVAVGGTFSQDVPNGDQQLGQT